MSEDRSRRHLRHGLGSGGRVLGIDVGYSKRKQTTGLCCLWWDEQEIDWQCEVARTEQASRLAALKRLTLSRASKVDAVAIDGPLRPMLEYREAYRAPESALSRGKFQRRGKPGPTNGGSGPRLHQAATDLARFSMQHLDVRDADLPVKVCSPAIVEAFPNLFLGVLCEEASYPAKPTVRRRWTDTLFPIVKGRLTLVLSSLLPQRRLVGDLELSDHEKVAALTCAITALCVAAAQFEAVGSIEDGFIVLPPERFWGRAQSGGRSWAGIELERTLAMTLALFPHVERWRP